MQQSKGWKKNKLVHIRGQRAKVTDRAAEREERREGRERGGEAGFSSPSILKVTKVQYLEWSR